MVSRRLSKATSIFLSLSLLFHSVAGIFYPRAAFADEVLLPQTPTIVEPTHDSYRKTENLPKIDWTDATGTFPPFQYQYQAFSDEDYTINRWGPSNWLNKSEIPTLGTPKGIYYVRVRARDSEGNITDWSNGAGNPHKITVDNTAPNTPQPLFPANGAVMNSSGLYIDWTDVTDPSGPVRYEYRLYLVNPDKNPGAPLRYQKDYYEPTSRHPAVGFAPGTPEDTYWWRVRACDQAENCSSWMPAQKFTVDNTPTIPGTPGWGTSIPSEGYQGDGQGIANYIACGGYVRNDGNAYRGVWGEAMDNTGISKYQRQVRGAVTYDGETTTNYTSPFIPGASSGAGEGIYYVRVRAIDDAGNPSIPDSIWNDTSNYQEWCSLTIDTTAPTSTISSPSSPGYFNTAITISGQTTDVNGVDKVTLFYADYNSDTDSCGVFTEIETLDNSANDSPYNWSYVWAPPAEGNYCLKASGTDIVGNIEDSAIIKGIVYDTTPPVIEGLDKLTANQFLAGDFSSLNFTDELSGIAESEKPFITYILEGGNIGKIFSEETWDTVLLPLGSYIITVKIKDRAGNSTTKTTPETTPVNINVLVTYSPVKGKKGIYDLTISWQTGWPTWGMVVYDSVPHSKLDLSDDNFGYDYSSEKVDEDPKTTTHRVTITNLEAGTIYYFRLVNGGSPTVISGEFRESTLPPTTTPPSATEGTVLAFAISTSRTEEPEPTGSTLGSEITSEEEDLGLSEERGEGEVESEETSKKTNWYWYLIMALIGVSFIYLATRRKTARV